jgi:DNA polymerase I-like protein with 3'-5' exonuclease and polymerase domains
MVGIDASGLELRMLAHYMQDDDYIKAVCEGRSSDKTDVHSINQRAAGLDTRDQAKTFIYAFLYGAGAEKIGSIAGGGAHKGKQLISAFLEATPALQSLRKKVTKIAEKGSLPGLDGRRLFVRSPHKALNTLLQGAGAAVMKVALVLLDDSLKASKIPYKFLLNVHDEVQIEVPTEHADKTMGLGMKAIEDAGVVLKLRCPLAGEAKKGANWFLTH